MMGAKLRGFASLPTLSLEELVHNDNFYRRLDRKLDLPRRQQERTFSKGPRQRIAR